MHRENVGNLLFSYSVTSNSLWLLGLQHVRLPCPSLSPGVCSNSCPLSQWYHPANSSSVTPFSSCPHSFPASGSLPMNQLFASGGQSIRASASASVLPMNIQGWWMISFRIDWSDLLASQRILKSLLQNHSLKASILQCSRSKLCILFIQKNLYVMLLSTSNSVRLWGNQDALCVSIPWWALARSWVLYMESLR